jgi:hypothetical protein
MYHKTSKCSIMTLLCCFVPRSAHLRVNFPQPRNLGNINQLGSPVLEQFQMNISIHHGTHNSMGYYGYENSEF